MKANSTLQERALELALEGLSEFEIYETLKYEFGAGRHIILAATQYALSGARNEHTPPPPEAPPAAPSVAPPTEAQHNKRAVRKAMIMLKVNYKEAGEDAVTDCLTDLQHYCMAKGIDYLACEERAQRHFTTEKEGGES